MRQLRLFRQKRVPRRGRPPKKDGKVTHRARPEFAARFPVHVTLRMRPEVWHLRWKPCFRAIERAFLKGNNRFGMRLVHFSVLGNHVHLICEAEGAKSLTRGMQGLSIRMAKSLNALMEGRHGTVFDDRFHSRVLRTPTEVKHAVRYVVRNNEKHAKREIGADEFSSETNLHMVVPARTWLLVHAPPPA